MLNVFAGEAVVLVAPRRIESNKEEKTKIFAFMELGIPPFGADKDWLKKMISEGRKTGYVFANAITVEGYTTAYALKNLQRGDLISILGSLSMMNAKEVGGGNYKLHQKIGIRIERIEKLVSSFMKYDKQKIARSATMVRAPGMSNQQGRKISNENNSMPEKLGSYQRETGILDDTEFNFED